MSARELGKRALELLTMILASSIVAAGLTVYLNDKATIERENSHLLCERNSKIIETFDSAQTEALAKITAFNNDVLAKRQIDPVRRAEVTQALLRAQLAANELERIIPLQDRQLIAEYKKELTNVNDTIQTVEQPLALGTIFDSVAHLLPLHEKLAADARANLRVRGLFGG